MGAPLEPRTGFAAPKAATRVPIHPALAERIVRIQGRSDRVAVTHLGETVSFDDPQAFRTEIRRLDREQSYAERAEAWDKVPFYARLQFVIADAVISEVGLIAAIGFAACLIRIGVAQ